VSYTDTAAIQQPVILSTLHIDPTDEAAIKDELSTLGEQVDTFVTDNHIDLQVQQWIANNDIETKVDNFGDLVESGLEDLDETNDISGWAQTNNIDGQIDQIIDHIDKNVTYTSTAAIQQPVVLSTWHIDQADEAEIGAEVQTLGN